MSEIEVGDRVTYKTCGNEYTDIVQNISYYEGKQILKIERPTYTVVEEKKELLTEEERELLKSYIKWIKNLNNGEIICIYRKDSYIVINLKTQLDYEMDIGARFEKMENFKDYTLQELGLEE